MEDSAGTWAAKLVLAHVSDLARDVGAQAQAIVPLYGAMPAEELTAAFVDSFHSVAQTLATGDLGPMRNHLAPLIEERIRAGAGAADLIAVVPVSQRAFTQLIEQAGQDDPARTAAAIRLVQTTFANMRMIFSEANLHILTQPRPDAQK